MGTSPRSRRAVAGAAALLIGTGLAACGSGDTPTDSSSTEASSSSSSRSLDKPEQQEIDFDTGMAALPEESDMPDGTWDGDASTEPPSEESYEPEGCAALEFASNASDTFRHDHRTLKVSAHYAQDEADGGDSLDIYVNSFAKPYPLKFFDAAGAHMDDCREFTVDGSTTYTTASVATPRLGDRSFGLRLEGSDGRNHNALYVRSGHNLIVVVVTTEDGYDERMLQKYARFVLDNLGSDS